MASSPATGSAARRLPKRSLLVFAVALIVLGAVVAYVVVRLRTKAVVQPPGISQVTSTGQTTLAALSPDAESVAYVVDDNGMSSVRIHRVSRGADSEVVAAAAARYLGLTFSPDGSTVFFARTDVDADSGQADVYRVPVRGGTPQIVVRDVESAVSISPDGDRMSFIRANPRSNEVSVFVAAADGSPSELRVATRPLGVGFVPGSTAAWSPDGRTIAVAAGWPAFTGPLIAARTELIGIDAATGKERSLTSTRWDRIRTIAWLDRDSLVVSGTQPGGPNEQLWLVLSDGTVRRITNDLNAYSDVATAPKTGALVTVLSDRSSTISTTLPDGDAVAAQVTSGTGRYDGQTGMAWTPDGRLVFSAANGTQFDLWIANADGSGARRVASQPVAAVDPSVTPDGQAVLFSSAQKERPGIWRIDLASGALSQVTGEEGDLSPYCLPDNQTVLFTHLETAGGRAYKVPVTGGGPIRATTAEVWPITLSADGRLLAVLTTSPRRIDVMPLASPGESKRFDIVRMPMVLAFTPDGDALTYLETRKGAAALWNQPVDGGEATPRLTLRGERIFSIAYAKDGRLAIAHGPAPSDAVLMTGVR